MSNHTFIKDLLISTENHLINYSKRKGKNSVPFFIHTEKEAQENLGIDSVALKEVISTGLLLPYFYSGDRPRFRSNSLMSLKRLTIDEAYSILNLDNKEQFKTLIKKYMVPYQKYEYTGEPYFHIKDLLGLKQKLQ